VLTDARVPILQPREQLWDCPKCGGVDRTFRVDVHSRFHACKALGGLTSPMVARGVKADVRVHEREDYVGTEDVPLVDGRPISSVEIVREDGNDVAVYAPTAYANGQGSI
jgi:hypothetical protein